MTPEDLARQNIDTDLKKAGWSVQDHDKANIHASRGVAIREFPLKKNYGFADYLLYLDGKAVGVIEAKKEGTTLTGVEIQAAKYSEGLPAGLPAYVLPLPFLFQSTGKETRFTNNLDPEPRSRPVFSFHKPETFAEWVKQAGIGSKERVSQNLAAEESAVYHTGFITLRGLLKKMPPLITSGLWPAQIKAISNLEESFAENRPRALIQMATGSGKTFTAISSIYRLIKFGKAKRILFLVDRANLGRQAEKEFQSYNTPDDGRKFTELYNVQRMTSNKLDPVAKVVITTVVSAK